MLMHSKKKKDSKKTKFYLKTFYFKCSQLGNVPLSSQPHPTCSSNSGTSLQSQGHPLHASPLLPQLCVVASNPITIKDHKAAFLLLSLKYALTLTLRGYRIVSFFFSAVLLFISVGHLRCRNTHTYTGPHPHHWLP